MSFRLRSRAALVLPIVLLAVVVIEEIAIYKLRQHVRDPYVRTAAVLAFFGLAFAITTNKLGPWLVKLLDKARTRSKREGGAIGVWLFYAVAYGALYYAFFVLETRGAAGLLPAAWR